MSNKGIPILVIVILVTFGFMSCKPAVDITPPVPAAWAAPLQINVFGLPSMDNTATINYATDSTGATTTTTTVQKSLANISSLWTVATDGNGDKVYKDNATFYVAISDGNYTKYLSITHTWGINTGGTIDFGSILLDAKPDGIYGLKNSDGFVSF